MKILRFLPLFAITASLLGASAFADDKDKKHDKKHDKDHDRDRGSDYHRGSDYNRPRVNVDIGIAPRPYYGPSSAVVVERRRPVIIERERPAYYGERRVYVERDSYAGRSIEARVQHSLAGKGYYQGPADGDIGPASRDAIRNYQRDSGLRPTGVIDDRLLYRLGLR